MKAAFSLDLANIPKELLYILELVMNYDESPISNGKLYENIDWNLFTELVRHHRLYPLLYTQLKNKEEVLPSPVLKRLETDFKKNTFLMLQLSAEMEYIGKFFAEHGIRTLFLKGPVLGQELYGDISLRTSSDLDVLIPINQLERADSILVNLGYVKDEYIQTVLSDWKWRHHHVTYLHPVKKTKVEVHWRLNPGPGKDPAFEELWERKRESNLTQFPVYLLSREDLFLFLVSHGARHGWSRLRWLVDIDRLVKKKLDWHKTYHLLKKYGYLHPGGQAVILANQLLHTKISKEMDSVLFSAQAHKLAQEAIFYFESMISLHTQPLPKEVSRYHKRHLFYLMSKRQKTVFILSFLYPYPEDAEILPLPKRFHFLYFLLRPFIWVRRKTMKHTAPQEDG